MKPKLALFKADKPADQSMAAIFVKQVNAIAGDDLLSLINYHDLFFRFSKAGLSIKDLSRDVVLENIADSYYLRDYQGYHYERHAVGRYLLDKKCTIYNSDLASNEALSKLEQMAVWSGVGLPVPKGIFVNQKHLSSIEDIIDYPVIVKSIVGSNGQLNFLVNSKDELHNAVPKVEGKVLLQEFIENDGDYRVSIIYGQPAITYKRIRSKSSKSHLNNVGMGASRKIVDEKDVEDLAVRAARALKREFCGVDIVRAKISGELYLLECNFNDGTRVLGDGVDEQYFKKAAEIIKQG